MSLNKTVPFIFILYLFFSPRVARGTSPNVWVTPPSITREGDNICVRAQAPYTDQPAGPLESNPAFVRIELPTSDPDGFPEYIYLRRTGVKTKLQAGQPRATWDDEFEEWVACVSFRTFLSSRRFSLAAHGAYAIMGDVLLYLSPGTWSYVSPGIRILGKSPERLHSLFFRTMKETLYWTVEYSEDAQFLILRAYGTIADTKPCELGDKSDNNQPAMAITIRPIDTVENERGFVLLNYEKFSKGILFIYPLCTLHGESSDRRWYSSTNENKKWGEIVSFSDPTHAFFNIQKGYYVEMTIPRSYLLGSPLKTYEILPYIGSIPSSVEGSSVYVVMKKMDITSPRIFLRFADEVHCCTIPKELLKGK